jgi:hypothetical protein
MAKVEWSAGIDSVSGALAKPSKSGQHSCSKMLLGTHRVAATTSNKCNNLYLRKPVKRSTPVSQNEMVARQRFSAVAALVKTRSRDLNQVGADQAAFTAQKDQPGGCKTLKKWYWRVCGQQYDSQQG